MGGRSSALTLLLVLADYQAVVLQLRSRLLEKNSWGQRELLQLVTELEVASAQDADPYRRFVHRFAEEMGEAFLNTSTQGLSEPLSGDAASSAVMPTEVPPSSDRDAVPKEASCRKLERKIRMPSPVLP